MRFRSFQKLLRTEAALPVTRDEAFVRDIVGDAPVRTSRIPNFPTLRRIAYSLSAAVFAFTLLFGGYLALDPVMVVTIDANPSFELRVNHFGRVIGLSALNADADAVVAAIRYRNATPADVVAALYDELVGQGFIVAGGFLLVGVDAGDPVQGAAFEAILTDALPTASLLCMSAFEDVSSGDYLAFKASPSFEDSYAAMTDERAAIWDDVFAAGVPAGEASADAGVTSTLDAWDDYHNGDVVYDTIYLDAAELAALAASLSVTEAKLRLAIAVFNGNPAFASMGDLEILAAMPVANLYLLYQTLP